MTIEFSKAFRIGPAFGTGWESLKKAPIPLISGGFIMSITEGCGGGSGGGGGSDSTLGVMGTVTPLGMGGTEAAVTLGLVALALVLVIGLFALRCFVHGGYLRLQRQVLKEGSASPGALFSGGDLFGSMALYKLIVLSLWLVVLFVLAIPSGLVGFVFNAQAGALVFALLGVPMMVWLVLGLTMGEHAIVFEGKSPVDALKRSLELAAGNRVTIFLYWLGAALMILVSLLGLLLLCVGVLVTVPAARSVAEVGYTRGFLLHTGLESEL